ncbi:MAG: ribosome biogenesis GTP-binding protein YsxC [Xanthomonadaceae bacterium]|nr:ribosome biogenesis GTP-binding protein YsxC [Xanthomonadaceae bacterium]
MAGQYLVTIGDISNIPQVIKDEYLMGDNTPRVAFVGRSNVGKSSLINAVLAEKKLAYVSKQPGKTKGIHFFRWTEHKIIVADLPGYGFAKTSKDERDRWNRFIEQYFKTDKSLARVYVLMDSRRGFMDVDIQAIEFLTGLGVDVGFVFTKIDQLKNQKATAAAKKEIKEGLKRWDADMSQIHWISAHDNGGIAGLVQEIREIKRA